MRDALANISSQNWKELPRENPASQYPSDFSLVEVRLHQNHFPSFVQYFREVIQLLQHSL